MDNKSEEVSVVTLMKEKTIEQETMEKEPIITSEPFMVKEEIESPAETEKAVEAENSAETEKAVEAESPAETEKAVEAENSAETEKAVEAESPAETEMPVVTESETDSVADEQMILAEQLMAEQSVKKGLFKKREKAPKQKKERVPKEKKVKAPKEKKEKLPREKKEKVPKEKKVKPPKEKKPRKKLFGAKNNVKAVSAGEMSQLTNSVNDVAIYGYSFSKKQLPAMIFLTVLGIATLGFVVIGLKIPAIILFSVHTIGWFAFFYKDVEYAEDELLFSRADNYLDDYWNISNSMNPYRKDNSNNNQIDNVNLSQTENAASEKETMIVEALQEKCRNQIVEMKELRSTITDYEKKLEESKAEKENLNKLINENEKQMHQFLPKLSEDNNNDPVNIISVCAQVVEAFKKDAAKVGVSISISTNSDAIMVKADKNRLRVLFRNIVDNSIKYMQTSGTLVITISNLGSDIFIVLKDNGNGLDESETPHIFELNYQGSNRISGNGLGLTQAKAIVEYYGGTIYAKSTLGRGMGIYIQLPTDYSEENVLGKDEVI